jgi:hypothetical protein
MKVKTHLRIAKTRKGARVEASSRPNYKPLITNAGYRNERVLPTAAFAVVLDIPDELFERAETVLAEITVDPDEAEIAAEVGPISKERK